MERAISEARRWYIGAHKCTMSGLHEIKSLHYVEKYGRYHDDQMVQQGQFIEPEGFSNFYPHFSPEGNRVAYVSNKGKDFNAAHAFTFMTSSGDEITSAWHYKICNTSGRCLRIPVLLDIRVKSGVGTGL